MAEMLQPAAVQSRVKLTEQEVGGESSASMKLARLLLAIVKRKGGVAWLLGLTDKVR